MNSFRLIGLDPEPFAPLFALDDDRLHALGARRVIADTEFGFPCRIGLEDATVGDELLLLPYQHQPAASPYRASGPIFVRRGARQRQLAAGGLPPYVSRRLVSLRAYDAADLMVDAEVLDGSGLAAAIARRFEDPTIAYLHLHNARRGCYLCRVERADVAA